MTDENAVLTAPERHVEAEPREVGTGQPVDEAVRELPRPGATRATEER